MNNSVMDGAEGKKVIDPLRRVFVPTEKRMTDGRMTFRTSDSVKYVRDDKGVIRRTAPKVKR